ncbi:MAG TPA: hypothetical protein DCS07_11955 [Bdellovibrionales bacterium]|nr:MAG: hypothetical protein A2Z97_07705 [Bdellovibrionales bacterium GWB1_52_6]OFZ04764.1 MAG: hypothetical protein A2X97_13645 [Bdellovibrionales bacterium GWA1_52_35]HAR43323.1 hypothetical protein [Bdellovibrionales bacterium]HCM39578.1 hypothetical protein [Bdellovibrionales bacterium]
MTTPLWLQNILSNPKITDICINGPQHLYVDQGFGLEPENTVPAAPWTEEEMRTWVLEQISAAGKSWDARHPFIDGTVPSGHRLHVAFPPLAQQGILVSLRRLPGLQNNSISGAARWAQSKLYGVLADAVGRGESVLIAGSTGSGKTTLATDLLESVPPLERILAIEDTPELAPRHPHFISLVSRAPNADGFGEVTPRTLLKQALRMRPDRIILGECRGTEVLDLLQALNTGHGGALATLHANSPRDALRRMELLCLLASGGSIPLAAIRELIAVGVQWIAQVKRTGPSRQISELARIEGREGEMILLRPITAN